MKYLIDTHMHTIASGHAYNTIDEMTQSAARKGFEYIAITEHAPAMPGSCGKLYFSNLGVLKREKYGVKRLFGCEVNIMDYDGKLDLSEYFLKKCDIVIASLHIPCIKPGSVEENTSAVIGALKNPYVNIIGHPDDSRYKIDMEKLVYSAKEHHKILELNNSSLKPDGPRVGARENDIEMLELCKKMKVPITLGSDAHIEEDIGIFNYAQELIEMVNFPKEQIVNLNISLLKELL